MGLTCTLFAVHDADLPVEVAPPRGVSDMLRYHDDRGSNLARLEECPSHFLDKAFDDLHHALGGHTGDHPLAFIVSGGLELDALASEGASGRYFSPLQVAGIARALRSAADASWDGDELGELLGFFAEAASDGRGLIVYLEA